MLHNSLGRAELKINNGTSCQRITKFLNETLISDFKMKVFINLAFSSTLHRMRADKVSLTHFMKGKLHESAV